jgi:hypothetical protein
MVAGLGLVLAGNRVAAHHAFAAEFDASKPVTLRGTLTKMEWVNPHGWLHIAVKQPDGTVVNWMGETGAPNALLRRGWTKESLPAGIEVVLEGYLAKNGTRKMTAMMVLLPNGEKLFAGSSGIGAPIEPPK